MHFTPVVLILILGAVSHARVKMLKIATFTKIVFSLTSILDRRKLKIKIISDSN
jgi:hypothetical protein